MPRKKLGAFRTPKELAAFQKKKPQYSAKTEEELEAFMSHYLSLKEFSEFRRQIEKKKKENK